MARGAETISLDDFVHVRLRSEPHNEERYQAEVLAKADLYAELLARDVVLCVLDLHAISDAIPCDYAIKIVAALVPSPPLPTLHVFRLSSEAKATKGGTTFTTLTTANSISFPGGVEVTTKGKIAIDDQLGAAVFTYNPPKNGSLGTPIKTTALTGSGWPGVSRSRRRWMSRC